MATEQIMASLPCIGDTHSQMHCADMPLLSFLDLLPDRVLGEPRQWFD